MVGTVPHTHPKPFPETKQKQEIAKSVLECDRLVFVLTVEILTQGGLLLLLFIFIWMDGHSHSEAPLMRGGRATRCSRVTQAYPVAAGVKSFSQHGG